ncbi:prepilin-type N-terminal cleavage/methylation domain-containing protein [bacterium]|nr:MAG: prepilin-type N-terminal cleavage/methylation domain-containing protein [bacterium]
MRRPDARRRVRRSGFTVIEMIVVMTMTAILIAGAFSAYGAAFGFDQRSRDARDRQAVGRGTEDQLRAWIHRAALSTVSTDTASYFIGGAETDSSTLTFTAIGDRPGASYAASNESFDTSNERFGPQGGPAEVSLSLTGIGDGAGKSGLFLRVQRPADGDTSQGGEQELIDPDIESMSFEFWTGESWTSDWNTQSMDTPRLPGAVRVTYRRQGEDQDRILTVTIPASDATAENPVTVAGATGTNS